MPPDRAAPGSPEDWLARAQGDLAIAAAPLPDGGYLEDLCFHAQQAAEKAIKAVYRAMNREFCYTHDIGALLSGLDDAGVAIPDGAYEAVELTTFAWEPLSGRSRARLGSGIRPSHRPGTPGGAVGGRPSLYIQGLSSRMGEGSRSIRYGLRTESILPGPSRPPGPRSRTGASSQPDSRDQADRS